MNQQKFTVFADDRYELDVLRGETQYILILNIHKDECLELVDVLMLIDGDYRPIIRHGFTHHQAVKLWTAHLRELEAAAAELRADCNDNAEIEAALLFHQHINIRR